MRRGMTSQETPHADPNTGEIASVNIGTIREVEHNGRLITTGIFKTPTTETQTVADNHIGNDQQADPQNHGGPHKAVYAYAEEDYAWWAEQLDTELTPAFFGENLTVRGIDVSGARVGDRWAIGTAVLEVSEARVPCFKLGIRTRVARIQQAFAKADRPGAYLRIIEPGALTVGDKVAVTPTDDPSISVAEMASIYHRDRAGAGVLLDVPALSDAWRGWAAETMARHAGDTAS